MRFAFPPLAIDGIDAVVAGSGIGGAMPASGHEGNQIAAVVDDVAAELDPRPMIQLVEIKADIIETRYFGTEISTGCGRGTATKAPSRLGS